ncbi:hypothetical protein BC938DRAFT_472550 [Jimgerdemannia flammicorona]|uniref:Uncharacterized protein n=1 Tax=Jimgerdemannia flammicorona TaxID=994334 RepID=A0A433Q5U9_9FUNG|nr:hypothetical protein BC938DRAFT_472550 [Jimgerdemannia flammicorona]
MQVKQCWPKNESFPPEAVKQKCSGIHDASNCTWRPFRPPVLNIYACKAFARIHELDHVDDLLGGADGESDGGEDEAEVVLED